MTNDIKLISKFLSLILRHKPEEINLQLDENGWVSVKELIEKANAKGIVLDKAMLEVIVETNDKKRFAFNTDKTMIRASQGHSIDVELKLDPVQPPGILYHGTATRFLESIMSGGLQKQSRQHVHLSATVETAKAVGSRHGKPAILAIDAKAMHIESFKFYLSANNVWLTDEVPVKFFSQ
jgi:putative RNA 2'-phosphotransferase